MLQRLQDWFIVINSNNHNNNNYYYHKTKNYSNNYNNNTYPSILFWQQISVFQMSPSIQKKKKQALFSSKLHKTPQNYFKILKSSRSESSLATVGQKKKKVRNPLSDLTARVLSSGTAAANANFSTKSCFPLRAAVRSVQTSQMPSSSGAQGGVEEADRTQWTRLLAPLWRGCQSVCFVSSDQPTRTGVSPPLAACEVAAAWCCSQVSPGYERGGVPAGTFKTKS